MVCHTVIYERVLASIYGEWFVFGIYRVFDCCGYVHQIQGYLDSLTRSLVLESGTSIFTTGENGDIRVSSKEQRIVIGLARSGIEFDTGLSASRQSNV